MSWQPLDCHAHTVWSDGALTPEQLVEAVRARGVRPGIADHLSGNVAGAVKTIEEVRSYLDELERHDVARGAEFCWHDALWRELPDDLTSRFTHRVGSLHAVQLAGGEWLHMFQRSFPRDLSLDDYMEAHLASLERLAAEMPVDILAHPTLLPLSLRAMPLEELWTEPREERAVAALRAAGIAFEISNRYRPHERFVQRAASAGVRLSLASDGHTLEQVGDLGFPLAVAREAGVPDEALYDPASHGARASA